MLETDDRLAGDPVWYDQPPGTARGGESKRGLRRNDGVVLLVPAALAAFLYGMFAAPGLVAVVLGCGAFGARDVVRAFRLLQSDPDPARGKVCARFTAAWGFSKVGMACLTTWFVLALVGLDAGWPPAVATWTRVWALAFGFLWLWLSGALAAYGVAGALRHRVKVWVGPRDNRASTVLLTLLIGVAFLAILVMLIPLMSPNADRQIPVGLGVLMILAMSFGFPFLILVAKDYLEKRVVAGTPKECRRVPLEVDR
jgi:hypothetical protein